MFEKEAEIYATSIYGSIKENDGYYENWQDCNEAFKKGAEYGYDKAKAELEERVKQQSDRITELTQELDGSINRFG